jgi:LysM repeat protein
MNARRFLLYLALNAVVSLSATFAALWIWDNVVRRPAGAVTTAATPTPTAVSASLPGVTPFPTVPAQPPALPQSHMVQSGETLGAIAQLYGVSMEDLLRANNLTDPNVLNVGQTLIIPLGEAAAPAPTAAPAVATVPPNPPATPHPNRPAPQVAIREVLAPGALAAETVVIANAGGPVDLAGWTLRDESGRSFTFPALTLFEGGIINVHSAAGQDTVIDLYWGQTEPVWASGRLMILADAAGALVARFTVP